MRRIVTAFPLSASPPPMARHGKGAYLKALREAAFAQGLCYECTCRPFVVGKRRCEHCCAKNRIRLEATFAAGACTSLCGRPRDPGFTRCSSCREKHRLYMEARRRAAGIAPRVLREPGAPRPPRRRRIVSSTSQAPTALPTPPAPSDPRPVEVDLSTRRAVIAALAARRAA